MVSFLLLNDMVYLLFTISFQEDKSRVELFKPTKHSKKKSESIWSPFLSLLNRPDGFIMNMVIFKIFYAFMFFYNLKLTNLL